jgi:glutathione synthase
VRIVFAISRAASVDETWTTVHLARIALQRGAQVRFVEPWDFEVDPTGRLIARAHAFDAPASAEQISSALVSRRAVRRYVDLERIDLLMLRAAPLDLPLLTFSMLAKERGVRVTNDPTGLLAVSHKGWLATLPDVHTPRSLVTRSRASCHVFSQSEPGGVVLKPARGSGGRQVSFVPHNDGAALDAAFELAREGGDGYVVAQSYLPEAADGEKRLVWLDGTVIGGYLRRRAPGEFRHNLKRGGQAEPTTITEAELELGTQIAPHLLRAGVRLAGLDVIGGHVIEVNALNPGGAFHADRLTGSRLGDLIVDRLTHHPHPGSPPGDAPSVEQSNPWAIPAP